jgi:hypothetical protein
MLSRVGDRHNSIDFDSAFLLFSGSVSLQHWLTCIEQSRINANANVIAASSIDGCLLSVEFFADKKITLTILMVGMVFLFAPHLYACHIVLMSFLSVLFMPILFAAFGTFPIILMVVAIYGWGMSWSQRY